MNSRASIELENFSQKLDEFYTACEALENSGAWKTAKLGPMSAYFEADLFAVALQVMRADGVFERAEAEVLNTMFATDYTPRQLGELYRSAEPVARAYVGDEDDALTLLATIDPELREQYRDLLLEACRIVSMSDGVTEKSERMLIAALREALA